MSDVVDYDGLTAWLAGVAGPNACVLTRSCCQLLGVSEERGGPAGRNDPAWPLVDRLPKRAAAYAHGTPLILARSHPAQGGRRSAR